MDVLAQIIVWLNAGANVLGRFLLAPLAVLPGWLGATLVAALSGMLLLLIFRYTSNQRAIKAVRNDVKANLLALKLFKDSPAVAFRAQWRVLVGARRLMLLATVPMLVMVVPVCLLLGQLSLWYQARPLPAGEETVVTATLNGAAADPWPEVKLEAPTSLEVIARSRVISKREICWRIAARENGHHRLVFYVDGQTADKELAVGDGFMRVSTQRPAWSWTDILLHPAEAPFPPDSPIRSIEIEYPSRSSWTTGTGSWLIYWFVVSLIAALVFRPLLRVNI